MAIVGLTVRTVTGLLFVGQQHLGLLIRTCLSYTVFSRKNIKIKITPPQKPTKTQQPNKNNKTLQQTNF